MPRKRRTLPTDLQAEIKRNPVRRARYEKELARLQRINKKGRRRAV